MSPPPRYGLSDHQFFVDALREVIGLAPLYRPDRPSAPTIYAEPVIGEVKHATHWARDPFPLTFREGWFSRNRRNRFAMRSVFGRVSR